MPLLATELMRQGTSINQKALSKLLKVLMTIPNNHAKTGNIIKYSFNEIARNALKSINKEACLPLFPASTSKLMVQLVEPYKGVVFDPVCQLGDSIVEAGALMKLHNETIYDADFCGQVANIPLWHICCMNSVINGIKSNRIIWDINFAIDTDNFKTLKADTILCSPPYNFRNFEWLNYCISHLNDGGNATLLLSKASLDSKTGNGQLLRENVINNNLLDCIVLLPDNIIPQKPLCIWVISKDRRTGSELNRKRMDEILFINTTAGHRGENNDLAQLEINKITRLYHKWKRSGIKGFSSAVTKCIGTKDIVNSGYNLLMKNIVVPGHKER